jgi:polyferredoxin
MDTKKKAGLLAYIAAPLITMLWFAIASLVFLYVLKEPSPVPIFIIFAVIQFLAMVLFALLPTRGKTIARVTSMFLIGSALMVMAGIFGRTNLQIEGFFFYILSGTVSGAIVHYAMAKIIGPLLYNRNWCSWGCWTSMFLDLLPYRNNVKWQKGKLMHVRYYHFVVSFLIVASVYYILKIAVVNQNPAAQTGTFAELLWFLIGNTLYYLIGISLAIIMKDNRAFCKYVCPITVLYKTVGRFSLLRIAGDEKKCTDCKTCISRCPMSVDIPRYIKNGQRVKATDCIMCMNCIAECPQAALKASIGLDFAGKNNLC